MVKKTKKDPVIFLEHILESIDLIEFYLKDVKKREFLDNEMFQDSVLRRIEIIGEAVKNISVGFKRKYNKIPWQKIAGMRDKVIHAYFGIDLDLVWNVVKKDIKALKKEIAKLVDN